VRERARRGRHTKEEGGVAASPPASYVATTVYPAELSWRVRCGVRLNFGNEFSLHRFTLCMYKGIYSLPGTSVN
jgi:hypothetical protein